jgi:NAD(P)H-dependent FMN reductase
MSEIEPGQKWRHKKRGSVYEIVAIDGSIQVASLDGDVAEMIAAMLEEQDWIVYRPVDGYKLHFRMSGEFLDGRFEQVA